MSSTAIIVDDASRECMFLQFIGAVLPCPAKRLDGGSDGSPSAYDIHVGRMVTPQLYATRMRHNELPNPVEGRSYFLACVTQESNTDPKMEPANASTTVSAVNSAAGLTVSGSGIAWNADAKYANSPRKVARDTIIAPDVSIRSRLFIVINICDGIYTNTLCSRC